jgi:hypothetical protein
MTAPIVRQLEGLKDPDISRMAGEELGAVERAERG